MTQVLSMRFTIRGFMVAVVVVAGLLVLSDDGRQVAIALSLPCLALAAAWWFLRQGQRQFAGILFGALAVSSNVLITVSCVVPEVYQLLFLSLGWMFVVMPATAGFGIAWAILITRGGGTPRCSPRLAWLLVIVLTVMPVVTVLTVWPLRLGFLITRPALERLADRVAAGQVLGVPRQVGPFLIVGSVVDPATGGVGLLIDPNPSGRTGFVRNARPRAGPFGCFQPIGGDDLDVWLGGRWCYHEED